MKIWMLLSQGIGNVCQTIPVYTSLIDAGHEVDVTYVRQYETDHVKNMWFYPCDVIEELTWEQVHGRTHSIYDYVIRFPMLYDPKRPEGYVREHLDGMRESDSEVSRNRRILESLNIPCTNRVPIRTQPTNIPDGKYIVVHNGSQQGWEFKKYPMMEALCGLVQVKTGMRVVSIGGKDEYVFGTIDATCRHIRESAYIIEHSACYIGTDTGTYHIAAALGKRGVSIFTGTSIGKNWDVNFHKTIKPIQRKDLDCCPCQLQYHWSIKRSKCNKPKCQNIPVLSIYEEVCKSITAT
jgi:hypothetical protein